MIKYYRIEAFTVGFLVVLLVASCSKGKNWYSSDLKEDTIYDYFETESASYRLIFSKSFIYGEPIESHTIEKTIIMDNTTRIESYDVDEGDTLIMSIIMRVFDNDDRIIQEYDSNSFAERKTRYEYLPNNVVKELAHTYVHQYDYSNDNRRLLSVDTIISEWKKTYKEGRIIKGIGTYRRNGLDKLSASLPPDTIINSFEYNSFDSLSRVINIRNNDTVGLSLNNYDSLRRKTQEVTVHLEIGEDIINYEYDRLNYLIKETWTGNTINEAIFYSYDSLGRRVRKKVYSVDEVF